MPDQPLIPRSRSNPVGQTQRIARARKVTNAKLRRIEKRLINDWLKLPVELQNGRLLTNNFYEYLISLDTLQAIVRLLSSSLQDVGQETLADQVRAAYREGTSKASENLARVSDDYTRTITQTLASRPVQRRAALAASRVFELMQGFSGDAAADLSRILFQAVQDGVSPRVVARDIRKRFGVHRRRAERIARTEITGALRRSYRDEVRDAEERFGFETRIIHYSALIPGRTRRTHAERHGKIFTADEQAQWYSRDGNAINCLCSQSSVIVENGEPITGQALLERLDKQRKAFLSSGAGNG